MVLLELLPCISNSQDQEGEKTVEEELVPVVGPLHVDLVLTQSGHSEGRATLWCVALEIVHSTRLPTSETYFKFK